MGKHLRQVHGKKWKCLYCGKQYSDKGSHKICDKKDEKLKIKLVKSYMNKSEPIRFLFLKNKFIFNRDYLENGPFIYFIRNILGIGHFSRCYYSFDTISGKEVAIKFALNDKKNG